MRIFITASLIKRRKNICWFESAGFEIIRMWINRQDLWLWMYHRKTQSGKATCAACSAGACQTDTTINLGIRYSSVAIACCFANVAQDVCKDGTKAFQQADDVLDTYGFRPRAVKEDWYSHFTMIPLPPVSPTEGRVGRIRMCLTSLSVWSGSCYHLYKSQFITSIVTHPR